MIRHALTLFIVLWFSSSVGAQLLPPQEIPEVACLHVDCGQDSLQFPGGRERFDSLRRVLDTLLLTGQGHLNILHIGGSHVQAGHFSHRVRADLAAATGMNAAGRGLLFPYTAMKSNAPQSYAMWHEGRWASSRCVEREPRLPLGLTGACIETSDTAARVFIDMASLSLWRTDTLRILGEGSTPDVVPMFVWHADTIAPLLSDGQPGFRFVLPSEADTCCLLFRGLAADSLTFRLRGVFTESHAPGITYCEAGINGASVPSWLRCTLLEQDLALAPPSLVIFGIGINDANIMPQTFNPEQFKANYRELIRRIRTVSPQCCFLFITNNDCWFSFRGRRRQYNTNTPRVQQAMRELAAEVDGAVFDVFSLMGGLRSSAAWVRARLQRPDHIHFTREGYELWGDLLYNALVKTLPEDSRAQDSQQ